jgi:acetyltransferase-like isoleucine patch superfamily enzyme
MKNLLLWLERVIFIFTPFRWVVLLLQVLVFRLFWIWGRWRFLALVPRSGLGSVCHWNASIKYPENLTVGQRVVIGVNVVIGARSPVVLEDHVRVSQDVVIETAGLDFSSSNTPYPHVSKPIWIEQAAWIGTRSIILGGVRIGRNAVVAAGSVVTRDVPPNTVVAGNPARVVKTRREVLNVD